MLTTYDKNILCYTYFHIDVFCCTIVLTNTACTGVDSQHGCDCIISNRGARKVFFMGIWHELSAMWINMSDGSTVQWTNSIQGSRPTNGTVSHYNDVIMSTMASQTTSLMIVYSTIYIGADQRKYQSSASRAFVREYIGHRWIPRTKGQ